MANNADGSLIFDTKVDDNGFKAGMSKLNSTGLKAMATLGKATAKAMAAMTAAAGAATIAIGKMAISAFADYEQLVGGVDTLFKDSTLKVQAYASEAFKTAGLSANAYMETVTSFSASLLQSLGGDTDKAADKANMAIIDMSDNANKMGTSMESIQNAYQGFAKQNYTMLDNLKLGYGGTKTEMERLLADAEKLPTALGRKFDVDSYADIVDAIHLIQEDLGIMGTTALEAEKTISGSFNMMKAAAENLLTGFGNPEADIAKLSNDLVAAFETVVANVTPVVQQIAKSLPEAIGAIIPAIGEILPDLIAAIPPIFEQILGALMLLLPELIVVAIDAIKIIADALIDNAPLLLDSAIMLFGAFADVLLELAPELIIVALELLSHLAKGLLDNVDAVGSKAADIIAAIVSTLLKNLYPIISAGSEIILALIAGILNATGRLIGKMVEIGGDIIGGIIQGIKAKASELWNTVKGIADGIISKFKKETDSHSPSRRAAKQVGAPITQGIAVGMLSEQNKLNDAITKLSDDAMNTAMSEAKDFKEVGKIYSDLMSKGIEDNAEKSKLAVTKLVNDAVATMTAQNKKAKTEYSKAGKEVISAYTTAIKDGVKKVQDEITAEVERITSEAQKQYDEIIAKKEDMERKLAGFGELFTIDRENGEMIINNLNEQIEAIQRYDEVLSNLKARGASDAFMSEITKLGVDEGMEFGQQLLKLSDEQFAAYEANWAEKQKLAKEVAAKFYKDQLETLQSDMVNRLDKALNSVPKIVQSVGVNAMEGMILGMDSRKSAAVGKAREIADAIIAEMQRAMDINSPSRVMRDIVGKNIVKGIEVGIDAEKASLLDKLKNVVEVSKVEMSAVVTGKTSGEGKSSVVTNNNDNGVNQTVNVYTPVRSPLELMREAKRAAKEMAYA